MKNTQNFQITGSSSVSFGNVNQTVHQPVSSGVDENAQQPIRILFMAANPPETSRLQLDREVKAIDQAIQSSGGSGYFELDQSWAVGDREIQDGLLRFKPDIVHMSAHGAHSGRLILDPNSPVRDIQATQPSTPETSEDDSVSSLARLFAATQRRIRCVVLNACHSEALALAIAEHVDCVVGMSTAIEDEAAIRFSWSFYNAIVRGQSVRTAFELAAAHVALGAPGRDNALRLVASKCDPAAVTFDRR